MSSKLTRYNWVQIRMVMVAAAMAMTLGAVLWKSYELQMVQESRFDKRSENQIRRRQTQWGRRGSILDRNGIELAVSVAKPTIWADPRLIQDKETAVQQLAALLGDHIEIETLRKRIISRRAKVYLARKVHPDLAEAVLKLKIPGVRLEVQHQRYYPLKDMAGHLLGGVTNRKGRDVGLEGIERAFDEHLQGKELTLDLVQDAWRRRMYLGDSPDYADLEGNSVVLSIDERIQYIAEAELAHAVRRFRALAGTVVVTNPKTGDILALATSTRDAPHFNPNRRGDYELKDFRNRALTDPFEPGSTFKPFVLASALQEGVVDVDEMIDVEGGVLKLGDYTIYDVYRFQRLKARDVVKYSSNIGAYKIARRLGKVKFGEYMRAFGFGQRTGVSVGGESRGLLGNTRRWDDRILASAAYGYGLMATNLQLNMSLGAIANGGVLMKPRLVHEVRDRDGVVLESFPVESQHRVLSEEVAAEVRKVMEGVIEHGGTGTRAALPYHRVAGKTGTARKVNPRTRRYDKSRILGSFIGMAPAEDPALVITVIIDQPTFGRGGGEVAAPVFKRIAEQALPIMNVYPPASRYKELKERVEREQEKEERRSRRRRLVERDERLITRERPDRDWKVPEFTNGVRAPQLDTELEPMPSYIGMSLREVLRHSREQGHLVDVRGAGVVTRQWPGPGVFVNSDVKVQVWLEDRE